MKKTILLFIWLLVASGCVSTPEAIYTPDQIRDQEMSLVKVVTNDFTAEGVKSSLLYIFDSDGNTVLKPIYLKSYPTETYLPAGNYTIQLICEFPIGDQQASPILPVSIDKLGEYHLTCEADETSVSNSGNSYPTSLKVNIKTIK